MKYLVIDDENDLYKNIFSDLFKTTEYVVEEIKKIDSFKLIQYISKVYFSNRVNKAIKLPFKNAWEGLYGIEKYKYEAEEQYVLIVLNGTLRYYFTPDYLRRFKKKHKNVTLVMVMYDNWDSLLDQDKMLEYKKIFDMVLSFDENDCEKFDFKHIYSTFSMPDFVTKDIKISTDAFFVGWAEGRLDILNRIAKLFEKKNINSQIFLVGVEKSKQESINGVTYNKTIPYKQELQYAYNTNCIIEIIKEGQSGMTLRTCEAIFFKKKLITNNQLLKRMPFYNSKYMKIISDVDDIDCEFVKEKSEDIVYENKDLFSPLMIIKTINESLKI